MEITRTNLVFSVSNDINGNVITWLEGKYRNKKELSKIKRKITNEDKMYDTIKTVAIFKIKFK